MQTITHRRSIEQPACPKAGRETLAEATAEWRSVSIAERFGERTAGDSTSGAGGHESSTDQGEQGAADHHRDRDRDVGCETNELLQHEAGDHVGDQDPERQPEYDRGDCDPHR